MKRQDMVDGVQSLLKLYGRPANLQEIARHMEIDNAAADKLVATLVSEGTLRAKDKGYVVVKPVVNPILVSGSVGTAIPSSNAKAKSPGPADHDAIPSSSSAEPARMPTDAPEPVQPSTDTSPTQIAAPSMDEAPIEPVVIEHRRVKIDRWQILVIRWAMASVGIASSVVSAYFAIDRLESFLPAYGAVIFGVVIVLFSVVAFETVIVFLRRRQRVISGVLIALWLTVWIFTLQAATAGMYSFYSNVQHVTAVSHAASNTASVELSIIRANEADLATQIDQKRAEIADIQRLLSQFSSLATQNANQYQYDVLQSRLLSRESDLTNLGAQLQAERAKELRLVQSTPAALTQSTRADFYRWISELTGWRADAIELVSSIFPALFLDTISVTALAIALFL